MGYARGYIRQEATASYITESPEWKFGKWVENKGFKNQLLMTESDRLTNVPILQGIILLTRGRSYHGLLNLAKSVWGRGVSNKPAVVINSTFLIISEIALWILLTKLHTGELIKYLAVVLFGFSAYVISMVEYTRFYMYVVMLILVAMNLMIDAWKSEKALYSTIMESAAAALVYLAYNNSEFSIVFFGLFSVSFVIIGIIRRKWKTVIPFSLMALCGGLYMGIMKGVFGSIINTLTVSGEAITADSVGSMIYHHTRLIISLFSNMFFGHKVLMIIWLIVLITGFVFAVKNKESVLVKGDESDFVLMLVISLLLYTLFTTLPPFWVWRYYCFGFLSFVIVFWFLLDRLTIKESKIWIAALLTLTFTSSIIPFFTNKVEYIYKDDKALIDAISPYVDGNVIYVCPEEDYIYDHGIYDCVNMLSNDARLFVVQENDKINTESIPDEVLLWSMVSTNTENIISTLKNGGYSFEDIGEDHVTKAYLCTKTE